MVRKRELRQSNPTVMTTQHLRDERKTCQACDCLATPCTELFGWGFLVIGDVSIRVGPHEQFIATIPKILDKTRLCAEVMCSIILERDESRGGSQDRCAIRVFVRVKVG